MVEKSSASPDAATAGDYVGGVCDESETGAGTGTGEGYARYELSAEGERATTASGFDGVSMAC